MKKKFFVETSDKGEWPSISEVPMSIAEGRRYFSFEIDIEEGEPIEAREYIYESEEQKQAWYTHLKEVIIPMHEKELSQLKGRLATFKDVIG